MAKHGSNSARAQRASAENASPPVASTVENHPAMISVKIMDEGTKKLVPTMIAPEIAAKCQTVFDLGVEQYHRPETGIGALEAQLRTLKDGPGSMSQELVEFGKVCSDYAGHDPGRTLSTFKAACAHVEQEAINQATKARKPKEECTIRVILPTWQQAKTYVTSLMAAHLRTGDDQFDIQGTSSVKGAAGKEGADKPLFSTMANVKSAVATARQGARSAPTIAGVKDAIPQLEAANKWLAKIEQGLSVPQQAWFAGKLSAFLKDVALELDKSRQQVAAATASGAQVAEVQDDARSAALRGGTRA